MEVLKIVYNSLTGVTTLSVTYAVCICMCVRAYLCLLALRFGCVRTRACVLACVCVCVCMSRLPPDYVFIDKNPAANYLVILAPFYRSVVAS
jgi:hypothetical protein